MPLKTPKIKIIWCTVLEIWSETYWIYCQFGSFFALLPPPPSPPLMIPKIKILKTKKNKNVWRYYPFIHIWVPQMKIIMIYGSWNRRCNILGHFLSFQPPDAHDRCNYFSFWAIFCLYPPNSLKKENFRKMKKTPGDVIILHKCTKNYDHLVYCCSWDMVYDGCKCYFSFWATFCPFTSLTDHKMEISKKWK